ncbi:MAG TPA: hypothetical protein VK540_30835 [Polyangiaceae bacterium]|nr:hypothetical protein [Polyangiaceae bacterium]
MRRALRRAFVAALLLVALAAPRLGHATDARPVVRVVLVTSGDSPTWFDGFVKHLERELGLRGIEVAVVRSERDSGIRRSGGGSASPVGADAELVIDAPSALRPTLRFSVPPRDEGSTSEGAGRVRQVNLAGVPADGWSLALAVAADELMRSNWPRAVPSEAARAAAGEAKASPGAGEETFPTASKPPEQAPRPAAAQASGETAIISAGSAPFGEGETSAAAGEQGARSPGAGSGFRSTLGAAAAGEVFAGGQTQVGPDVRWAIRAVPRLEVEIRGGWRRIVRRDTTNGAVAGSAFVAGGALKLLVLGGARANLSFVGRADLLRAAYSGEARNGTIDATSGNALGFVVAAGPCGRLALTRSLGLDAEVLAGASPMAITATDAGNAVLSTNGAAVLASLGLSLGL